MQDQISQTGLPYSENTRAWIEEIRRGAPRRRHDDLAYRRRLGDAFGVLIHQHAVWAGLLCHDDPRGYQCMCVRADDGTPACRGGHWDPHGVHLAALRTEIIALSVNCTDPLNTMDRALDDLIDRRDRARRVLDGGRSSQHQLAMSSLRRVA